MLALLGLLALSPLLALLWIVGWFDTGAPLFRQQRVGKDQRVFTLIKFRTMRAGTPSVPTHEAQASAITPFGRFLRRSKLDELPQLWNVLKGEMSLVGPRPCLPEQVELIRARERYRVFSIRPGITGPAQISGVDMSDPERLARLDAQLVSGLDLPGYIGYLLSTVVGRGSGDRVGRR